MTERRGTRRRERGFVLLLVLWTLGALALLVSQFLTAGRTELRVSADLRAAAVARAAADGAVHETVLRLLQGRWPADGSDRQSRHGDMAVRVRVEDQIRLFNPNLGAVADTRSLLMSAGVDPSRAATLARAILDWRSNRAESLSGGDKREQYRAAGLPYAPSNQAFESIDELGLVLGMTPDILARLRPLVSIYKLTESAAPVAATSSASFDPDAASAPSEGAPTAGGPDRVVLITATAAVARATFSRRAVVRLSPAPPGGQPFFQILTWETGAH